MILFRKILFFSATVYLMIFFAIPFVDTASCKCIFAVNGSFCQGDGSVEIEFGKELDIFGLVSQFDFGPFCPQDEIINQTMPVIIVDESNCSLEESGEQMGHTYQISCAVVGGGGSDLNSSANSSTNSNLLGSVQDINKLNQLGSKDIPSLLGNIIAKAMGVMGSIALVMIVYGGFLTMTAAGNAENVKKGTNILIWSTLGLVVIFASYMIVDLVFEAFR